MRNRAKGAVQPRAEAGACAPGHRRPLCGTSLSCQCRRSVSPLLHECAIRRSIAIQKTCARPPTRFPQRLWMARNMKMRMGRGRDGGPASPRLKASDDAALAGMERLHEEVDVGATSLARLHEGRLRCARGCCECCIDGLSVFTIEAARIQRSCEAVLNEEPHPPGRCAFLSAEGSCRIYRHRPYVCRTQGLPLRFFESSAQGAVEYRDICPLNEPGGPPLDTLLENHLWTIGPYEGRLADLQLRFDGSLRRVALRSLFSPAQARSPSEPWDADAGEQGRSALPGSATTRSRR